MDLYQKLKAGYVAALEATDPGFIRTLHAYRTETGNGLNDIFFPTVSANYSTAPLKVMDMGRETRTWNHPAAADTRSLADYVACGMKEHEDYRDSEQCLQSKTHGSGLVRLLKAVVKATGEAGLMNRQQPAEAVWKRLRRVDVCRSCDRNSAIGAINSSGGLVAEAGDLARS